MLYQKIEENNALQRRIEQQAQSQNQQLALQQILAAVSGINSAPANPLASLVS